MTVATHAVPARPQGRSRPLLPGRDGATGRVQGRRLRAFPSCPGAASPTAGAPALDL